MFAASKTASVSGGYQISRSLRFNQPDSTKLTRTFSTNGTSQKTCTISIWVKLSSTTTNEYRLIDGYNGSSGTSSNIRITNNQIILAFGGGSTAELITSAVYRDYSAWYHIVASIDSTQATSSDRMKLYVNGVQVTAFSSSSYPTQNANYNFMYGGANNVIGGSWDGTSSQYTNGYMTEVNFIDGQALTPSSFGETNAQTGVWQPKAYSGSYGTNGFYLNFSDNSNTTAATLGKDYSGNGNNWTPNNFSVTAGAGNDSLVDSPTSYGTDTGVGGEVRGNYATLNPLVVFGTSTFTNGNLDVSVSSLNTNNLATIAIPTSGKWYWEYQITSIGGGGSPMGGIASTSSNSPAIFYRSNGDKLVDGTSSAYGATYTTTDIVGVAVNTDGGTITFYKNGSSQGAVTYATSSGSFFPALRSNAATDTFTVNFGQRPFAYTAPSGYKALCTQNLPTPTIGATSTTQANKYYDENLYTGNGSTQSITNTGSFQPDFVWIKSRSDSYSNFLFDAVRGTNKSIFSNNTNAEVTDTNALTAFNSNGFTMGAKADINGSGSTYVGWQWKANGSGSTNTAGSITSTVSANTTSGFSIVTYTGNGTDNATIGHGLGVAPSMIIVKSRSNVTGWPVWQGTFAANDYMDLQSTGAKASASSLFGGSNASLPTSTVFKVGTNGSVNASSYTYVAYCFAEVAGYSKFGSYTGNGSTDGPFVFTGMRPAWIIFKKSSGADGWIIMDSKRNTYNIANAILQPNNFAGESVDSANYAVDFLSNGFKIRNSSTYYNESGGTLIYAAFAENPFKYSLAR